MNLCANFQMYLWSSNKTYQVTQKASFVFPTLSSLGCFTSLFYKNFLKFLDFFPLSMMMTVLSKCNKDMQTNKKSGLVTPKKQKNPISQKKSIAVKFFGGFYVLLEKEVNNKGVQCTLHTIHTFTY